MKKKSKKSKGRPPRYVLDRQGREIVGLSYNASNGMFYVTGSNPRIYFRTGGRGGISNKKENYAFRLDNAIQQFVEWKKLNQLTPKEQEEQIHKDSIHKKAQELIKSGYIDEYIYERAYDLITDDPIEAALRLGIKNLIFLNDKNFYYPFTLDLVWELFKHNQQYTKDRYKFLRYKNAWDKFHKDMKTNSFSGITKDKIDKWKEKLYQEYVDDDEIIELLACLDVIFGNVLKHNYRSESVIEVVNLIHDLYTQVS